MNLHAPRSLDHSLKPGRPRLMIALCLVTAALAPALLCAATTSPTAPVELGRLFFTPAQRAQLDASRSHTAPSGNPTQPAGTVDTPAPLRFDGQVIRSDGRSTRWVNGAAEVGNSSVSGLKPGQIRANGKVYEPYQVLRPSPAAPSETESNP